MIELSPTQIVAINAAKSYGLLAIAGLILSHAVLLAGGGDPSEPVFGLVFAIASSFFAYANFSAAAAGAAGLVRTFMVASIVCGLVSGALLLMRSF